MSFCPNCSNILDINQTVISDVSTILYQCNSCPYMKLNTIEAVKNAQLGISGIEVDYLSPEIMPTMDWENTFSKMVPKEYLSH